MASAIGMIDAADDQSIDLNLGPDSLTTPPAVPAAQRAAPAAHSDADKVLDNIWGDQVANDAADTVTAGGEEAPEPPAATPLDPVVPAAPEKSDIPELPEDILPEDKKPKVVPKAPVAPVEEDTTKADEEFAKGLKDPKQRNAFIHKTQQIKQWKAKAHEVEAALSAKDQELATLKAKLAEPAVGALETVTKELEETKARLKAIDEELGRTNFEKSGEYQAKYLQPQQAAAIKTMRILETLGGQDKATAQAFAKQLLQAKPQERLSLINDQPGAVQSALISASMEFDDHAENARIALDNWKAQKAVVEAEQKRMNQLGLVENLTKHTEKAVQTLVAEGNGLFARSQKDEKWNQGVQERIDTVRGVLQKGDPELMIKYMMDGASSPVWQKMYWDAVNAYRNLKESTQKVLGANPGVGGGTGGAQDVSAPAPKPKDVKGVMDSIWGLER